MEELHIFVTLTRDRGPARGASARSASQPRARAKKPMISEVTANPYAL
jgi:hypothetical protein